MSATAATTTTTAFEERPVTPDQPITRHEGDSSCKRRFYTLIDFRSPHTTKKSIYQRLHISKRTGERWLQKQHNLGPIGTIRIGKYCPGRLRKIPDTALNKLLD